MTDSDLALFESSSYRNFPAGENGFTWAESHFDRPKGIRGDSRELLASPRQNNRFASCARSYS